jgi:pilus assembly protein Flp/PilA
MEGYERPIERSVSLCKDCGDKNRETKMTVVKRLWKEEEGQDLTEYALLMVLIALVAIASMQTLGTTISNVFSNAAGNLTTAS